jgi:hypothetical protein
VDVLCLSFRQREPSELALHGFWLVLHTIRRMVARDTFTSVTLEEFKDTLSDPSPPDVSPALVALWHDARGDWEKAIARKATSATRAIGIAAHIVPSSRIR